MGYCMEGRGRKLSFTVTVKWDSDGDGVAELSDEVLSGAMVYATLIHLGGGGSWNYNSETDSEGKVTFTLNKASKGNYEALVTDITHSIHTYVPSMDIDNPDNYTV